MKESKKINKIILEEIVRFFGLGNFIEYYPAKQGISNQNYFVNTTKGEYVVKILINQSENSIKNDIYIQKCLEAFKVRCPKYISTNGKTIFEDEFVRAVISERIKGEVISQINTSLAKDFGKNLAIFHISVKDLPYPNSIGLMNPEVSCIKSEIFSRNLPRGIIHGDFHLGNALAVEDKITAILDFEEAGENVLLIDLALTIMGVCSYSNNNIDNYLVSNLLKGYEEIRMLQASEKKYFSEAITYASESWIKWFTENGFEKYAENHRKRLDSFGKIIIDI